MNPKYPAISARAGHRCEYCRAPEVIFNVRFEVEHIVPPGLGGSNESGNLALACRSCNVAKSNAIEALDPNSGRMIRLLHPRNQKRNEHFQFDSETGQIVGTSPEGRATTERPAMNDPIQLVARLTWHELKLY